MLSKKLTKPEVSYHQARKEIPILEQCITLRIHHPEYTHEVSEGKKTSISIINYTSHRNDLNSRIVYKQIRMRMPGKSNRIKQTPCSLCKHNKTSNYKLINYNNINEQ